MAKVTITTDDGELIEMITDDELPEKATTLSMAELAQTIYRAIKRARQMEAE